MDTCTEAVTRKRRYRALEQKRRIVEETMAEGASVGSRERTELTPTWFSTGGSCIKRGDWAAAGPRCCRSK